LTNIAKICDAIILYQALLKRKVYLDAFSDGLEVYRLRTAINLFPKRFKDLFVSSDSCSPGDVLAVLKFPSEMNSDEERVANYLRKYVRRLQQEGI